MSKTLELNYHLQGHLHAIYPAILDLRHFGKHHPYMKEVTLLQSSPEFNEYDIREMVWIFGIIPQWPRYTAKVFEREKNRHIQYTSQINGGIGLKIDFLFSKHDTATRIEEMIEVRGNAMLSSILLNTIQKAHGILFRNLEQNL